MFFHVDSFEDSCRFVGISAFYRCFLPASGSREARSCCIHCVSSLMATCLTELAPCSVVSFSNRKRHDKADSPFYLSCRLKKIVSFNSVRSKNHQIYSINQTKYALSPYDNTRYWQTEHESPPYGHYLIHGFKI